MLVHTFIGPFSTLSSAVLWKWRIQKLGRLRLQEQSSPLPNIYHWYPTLHWMLDHFKSNIKFIFAFFNILFEVRGAGQITGSPTGNHVFCAVAFKAPCSILASSPGTVCRWSSRFISIMKGPHENHLKLFAVKLHAQCICNISLSISVCTNFVNQARVPCSLQGNSTSTLKNLAH